MTSLPPDPGAARPPVTPTTTGEVADAGKGKADHTTSPVHQLLIVVHGRPITQGSKTKGRFGNIRDANADTLKPWRDNVRSAAREVLDDCEGFGLAPVDVYIDYYFDRPRTHYRTGRNAHLLRGNAPARPANKTSGDLDKLQRSCFDALTDAAVWTDDCQVVDVRASKWFTGSALGLDHPGAIIRVCEARP